MSAAELADDVDGGDDDTRRRSIIGITASVVIGGLVAAAGSVASADVGGLPVFALCAVLAFVVNWVAFVPAYAARTEKYYDITGTATYLTITTVAVVASADLDLRAVLAAVMVAAWALRLGIFLFRRISASGGDDRFDDIKHDPLRFFMSWSLQGLWCLMTAAAALAIITAGEREAMGVVGWVGFAVWAAGWTIEIVADQQKNAFREAGRPGGFISSGLWAWSQHPNYFGEITLWTGMAIMSLPVLEGARFAVLLSPVFVYLLLTRVSGIPMLRRKTKQRFGDDPEWQAYDDATPLLVPRPPG